MKNLNLNFLKQENEIISFLKELPVKEFFSWIETVEIGTLRQIKVLNQIPKYN